MAHSLENQVLGATISLMILPIPFVLLRLFSRRLKRASIALDDLILIWALIWQIANCVILIVATTRGNLGHHEVNGPDHLPVVTHAHIVAFQMQYVSQILSLVSNGSIKISLLLLYRRIFAYRTFYIITSIWIAIILCWMIGFSFATIFQCSPINTFWTQPLAEATPGKCFDIYAFYLSTAITGLLTDAMVLALPIPAVMRLQIRIIRKVSIAFIFLLGCIVLVFGAIRIQVFFVITSETAESRDLSYLVPKTFYWTLAETSVGIVCACLPTMVPVFDPKIEGSISYSLTTIPLLRKSSACKPNFILSWEGTNETNDSKCSGSARSYSETKPYVYAGMPAESHCTAEPVPLERQEDRGVSAGRGIVAKQDVYVNIA